MNTVESAKTIYNLVSKPLTLNLAQLYKRIQHHELEIRKGLLYLSLQGYLSRLKGIPYRLVPIGPSKQINQLKYREYGLYINDQFISSAFGSSKASEQEMEYEALLRTLKDLLVASELWEPSKSNSLRNKYFKMTPNGWKRCI